MLDKILIGIILGIMIWGLFMSIALPICASVIIRHHKKFYEIFYDEDFINLSYGSFLIFLFISIFASIFL